MPAVPLWDRTFAKWSLPSHYRVYYLPSEPIWGPRAVFLLFPGLPQDAQTFSYARGDSVPTLIFLNPNLSTRQKLANLITGLENDQCKMIVYKARSGTYVELSYVYLCMYMYVYA